MSQLGKSMLAMIHEDHQNIAALLDVLRHKLERLRQEQGIRYGLVRDIVEYLHTHADRYHHPAEDVIYEYYLAKHEGSGTAGVNRLGREHKDIGEHTRELQDTLEMILKDAVVPQDQFIAKLDAFIAEQQAHMDYEEQDILPLLESELTEVEWREIAQNMPFPVGPEDIDLTARRQKDPLFGTNVAEQYEELAERIRRHEGEEAE